jgi:hypothetical protein
MSWGDVILWGFAATVVLTTLMSGSKYLGLSRIDIPFLLGSFFTPNRNRIPWIGFMTHLLMGWLIAFLYDAAFQMSGITTWWFGALLGLIHAAFVLVVGMQLLNSIHPRMARPFQGPTPTRQLEPPGFLALNYGRGTPIVTVVGHVVYGGILGGFL